MEDFNERLNSTAQDAMDALSKIGVHVIEANLGVMPTDADNIFDPEFLDKMASREGELELFEDDKVRMVIEFVAETIDLAFSDKVLNPELHELNKEIRYQLPTEEEAELEALLPDLIEGFDDDD